MTKFKVLRRVDAWVDYVVEVQAETPVEASLAACQVSEQLSWERVGSEEFWNARFAVLDDEGAEMPETVVLRG